MTGFVFKIHANMDPKLDTLHLLKNRTLKETNRITMFVKKRI
jgi:peptide subunit release factor RF-3